MIRSMTGYGRGENVCENRRLTVEIKSVNHRYNDMSIKLPRSMNYLEDKIRKTLLKKISRGKTDVYINFETFSGDDVEVKLNEPLADAYIKTLRHISDTYNIPEGNMLSLVSKFPDVITVEKVKADEELVWELLFPAIDQALTAFIQMREVEGAALKIDILKKADGISDLVSKVKARAPFVALDYKARLQCRLAELLDQAQIDEQRIAAEVTVFADRACIDEELTRLESHISQLCEIMDSEDAVGRKLDFLIQEMNREANTIVSKANDITITRTTVELKSEIEKIREQIQNIE